ncbi:hypothetical protein, conserved [Plasmodium gonderi]|uniref:Uncharacterized protein n=1 Tax=Plasmodium gonderi TaxID=77519 RepID=A0A1Y1JJW1_PLAGO|nr:hypothetical protein, conserved [Plasmodium gonderi]GAW80733.1 hypothetical protein, conserved [Plasmodium gonderi]
MNSRSVQTGIIYRWAQKNGKSYLTSARRAECTNENTACESTYEYDHSPNHETHELQSAEFRGQVREDIFPYESLTKIEGDNDHKNKTHTRNVLNLNQLGMEKELIFQNEMLRNVLRSSQNVKEMQRELFNVDVRDFVPVSPPPPEAKSSYSIRRNHSHFCEKKSGHNEAGEANEVGEVNEVGEANEVNEKDKNRDSIYAANYGGNVTIRDGNQKSNPSTSHCKGKNPSESKLNLHQPRIGEIKVNIDDIKSSLLSYYSNVYSLDHYDIEERINILKYGEKNISDSVQTKYCYKKRELPQRLPFLHYNDELNNSSSFSYQTISPDYYYAEGIHRSRDKREKYHSDLKYSGDKRNIKKVNAFESEYDHVGQISELLTSLKNKCADASFKAQNLTSKFERKYENPDNRFWIHNLVPMHLRKPSLHNEDDIRNHLVVTYSQLHNEAMLNKKRIEALEKKLHILKLRANLPKGGYRMETRNAL